LRKNLNQSAIHSITLFDLKVNKIQYKLLKLKNDEIEFLDIKISIY